MRTSIYVLALVPIFVVAQAHPALAQASAAPVIKSTRGIIPDGVKVYEISATRDGSRVYYTTTDDEVWLHDRTTGKSAKVTSGDLWDVTVSGDGSVLAYTMTGEKGNEEYIWTLPLDRRTGTASGPARRVSTIQGDVPAISPDARFLAFARDDSTAGQSLMVVPLLGGIERLITDLPRGIDKISWSPDGKTIYYGTTAPDGRGEIIYRVSATGGKSTLLARAGSAWPGLSPDGKYYAYQDSGAVGRIVIADANGRRLAEFNGVNEAAADTWLGNNTLLSLDVNVTRQVKRFDVADGSKHVLLDHMRAMWDPAVSRDGKLVSVVHTLNGQSELVILESNGAVRKRIPLLQTHGIGNEWSPDGKWIAYQSRKEPRQATIDATRIVEVATGRDIELMKVTGTGPFAWSADSRYLWTMMAEPVPGGQTQTRRVKVYESDVTTGRSRVVSEFRLEGERTNGHISSNGDIVVVQDGRASRMPVHGTGTEKLLLDAPKTFMAVPAFSNDGKWVALKNNPTGLTNTAMTVLDVMHVDGSNRTTVKLPFSMAAGIKNPLFLQGGSQLMVLTRPDTDKDPEAYMVAIPDGTVRKLFSFARDPANTNGREGYRSPTVALTPDGRSIFYTERVDNRGLTIIDLTALLAAKGVH